MATAQEERGAMEIDQRYPWAVKHLRIKSHFVRELIAEFIGTALLIVIGQSGDATSFLSNGTAGNTVTAHMAWGIGVFFAIYMTKEISGGLLNPAIVLAWAFMGKLEWKKVIPYSSAEIAGAFAGAAVVHALYYDAINAFDSRTYSVGPNGTASIFATYPRDHLSLGGAVFDQLLGTCGLVVAVLIAIDPNNGLPQYLMPFAVGLYVMCNGYIFAFNAGGGINPARDFGPRLWTAIAGWGPAVFSYWDYTWFWIPAVCPLIGALLGAVVYNGFIGIHWPESHAHDCAWTESPDKGVSNDAYDGLSKS